MNLQDEIEKTMERWEGCLRIDSSYPISAKGIAKQIIQHIISTLPEKKKEENPCVTCRARETNCEIDCVASIQYTKAFAHNSCLSTIKKNWGVE